MYGKKCSEETRKKMSENSKNSKIILNTQTGVFYDSIKDAGKSININYSTLRYYLQNNCKNKTPFILV